MSIGYSEFDPLRDEQERPPVGECARCGGEIYGMDADLCADCDTEIHSSETVVKYAEAFPRKLFRFLWDEASEDYMKVFLDAFREYSQGTDEYGPDIEAWTAGKDGYTWVKSNGFQRPA